MAAAAAVETRLFFFSVQLETCDGPADPLLFYGAPLSSGEREREREAELAKKWQVCLVNLSPRKDTLLLPLGLNGCSIRRLGRITTPPFLVSVIVKEG